MTVRYCSAGRVRPLVFLQHVRYGPALIKEEPMATNARSFVKREGINPISVTVFTVFHVGAIASSFFFSWPAFFTALVLYWVSLSLGIGMGYHRLLTHRSYKSPKWIEYFLATCGTLALQGGPMFWVAAHRVHHQFSDKWHQEFRSVPAETSMFTTTDATDVIIDIDGYF